jgi:hypothetical protein
MSIWAAAGYIVAVSLGAFAAVFAKMVYKEVHDARRRPTQLPLPPMEHKREHQEQDDRVHATV